MKHPTPPAIYCPFWLMGLTDLFLAATHGSKTRITSQGEHAYIRPSPKSSPVDVGYYNPPPLRSPTTSLAPSDSQWAGLYTNLKHLTLLARYCPLWPMGLTDLFLTATHGSKTRLTSQGEHAHIRPSPKSSPVDVRYYSFAYLNRFPQLPCLKQIINSKHTANIGKSHNLN
jgi:hypothetical protein